MYWNTKKKSASVLMFSFQFVCEEPGCDKKFYKSILFEGHLKTHLNQKDFMCSHCGQKYFLKSHLQRHIRAMHDKIKINCELCTSNFVRKETYRKHVLNQHSDLNETEMKAMLKKIREMNPGGSQ
jgi:uncharacterized Zn-finger protein